MSVTMKKEGIVPSQWQQWILESATMKRGTNLHIFFFVILNFSNQASVISARFFSG
jgi:hypothetical protein